MPRSGGRDADPLRVRWLKVCGSGAQEMPQRGHELWWDGKKALQGGQDHLEATGELRPEWQEGVAGLQLVRALV